MKWYNSATSLVSLKWIGEVASNVTYPIPPFTMITDEDKTIVYTITGYVPSTVDSEFSINQVDLPQNGNTINVKCIQGIAVKYDINGDTVITPQHLDSDNRIYFNVSNIAENGIFITNTGSATNYGQWQRKDNLLIEDFGNYYYKFGITEDGTACYLEFPEDCETIMKDGIEITYIRSDGEYGNITANQLTNFYSDLSVVNSIGDQVVLNAQNVRIRNYFSSTDGKDYEDINSAYKNYKRVVGTFNTLVTLRDYFNYIVSHNLASNGFVCDRSNDLQNVYDIMMYANGVNQSNSIVEKTQGDDPTLTAFSIKLYLTKYYQDVSTLNSFNGTFQPIGMTEAETIQEYIEDIKSLQHDFVPLDAPNDIFSHFCFFKNKYPVVCNIIPQYSISDAQKMEIISNIKIALYKYLNAQEIEFGEKIKSDYLFEIITKADNRIKTVMLDNINYTTYAVYYDNNTRLFYEVQVSGDIPDSCVVDSVSSTLKSKISVNPTTFINKLVSTSAFTSYEPTEFHYDSGWKIGENSVTLSQYGITISSYTPADEDTFTVGLSKQTQFRNEIRAKSMLAGITPLLVHAEQFDFQINQSYRIKAPVTTDNPPVSVANPIIENIISVFPKTVIEIEAGQSISSGQPFNGKIGQYKLRDNETIQLFSPNLLIQQTYNNYVKFECKFNDSEDQDHNIIYKIINSNNIYQLQANEYIVFYWKASSSDTIYSYAMYGEGSIIKPSFPIRTNTSTTVANSLKTKLDNFTTLPKVMTSNYYVLNYEESQEIQNLRTTENILSDNKQVEYYVSNTITIDVDMPCYWILNQQSQGNETQIYTLFDQGQTQRILDSGEYFIYSDVQMANLMILGEGTLIQNTNPSSTDSWTVQAIPITDITLNGIDALNGYWYRPQAALDITEEQFITVNSGYSIKLELKDDYDSSHPWSIQITNDGTTFTNCTSYADFNISYQLAISGSDWISVPDLNLDSNLGWQGKSLLGLNISKYGLQALLSNQFVYVKQLDETEIVIEGQDVTDNRYPVVLLADHDVYANGQLESSTIYYSTYFEESYLSLYVFAQEFSQSNKVVYGNSVCTFTIPQGAKNPGTSPSTPTSKVLLPPGYYVIPVFVPSKEGIYAKISFSITSYGSSKTYLYPIYDSSLTILPGGKLYPLVYQFVDNSNRYKNRIIGIELVDENGDPIAAPEDMTLQFYNPLKYIPTADLAKDVALVRMFDSDDIFDYTYEVSADKLISDPLEAKQFLNPNHIYKKYTICQLDTSSNTNIQVN